MTHSRGSAAANGADNKVAATLRLEISKEAPGRQTKMMTVEELTAHYLAERVAGGYEASSVSQGSFDGCGVPKVLEEVDTSSMG